MIGVSFILYTGAWFCFLHKLKEGTSDFRKFFAVVILGYFLLITFWNYFFIT